MYDFLSIVVGFFVAGIAVSLMLATALIMLRELINQEYSHTPPFMYLATGAWFFVIWKAYPGMDPIPKAGTTAFAWTMTGMGTLALSLTLVFTLLRYA